MQLREQLTQYYLDLKIPEQLQRVPDGVEAPSIAVVSLDGGRYQVLERSARATAEREQARDQGKRKKGAHWKESRIASVMSMSGPQHQSDPMPKLPVFLAGGRDLQRKLSEIGHVMSLPASATDQSDASEESSEVRSPRRSRAKPLPIDQRPVPCPDLVDRNCLASAACWQDFGEMVAAEAWLRGFAGADRKACICDGNDAIRRVCETHFSDYVHILDMMHALGYAMNAARAVGGTRAEINDRYRGWAQQIWAGQVSEVILQLDTQQKLFGDPPKDAASDDPREAIRKTRVYYGNQQDRMDYPRYRQLGLPLTSSLMESAVKQIGRRVKGSEKSWSATGGDELLALRGDVISDNDRLSTYLKQFANPTDGTRAYGIAA